MKNITGNRTDLFIETKYQDLVLNKTYKLYVENDNGVSYRTIYFPNLNNINDIRKILIEQLNYFINKFNSHKKIHVLIIGIGNDNHTADSIGPKTLKYINVNSFFNLNNINITTNIISALEPGVLGETGIPTKKIIESVAKEVNPDLIILIDSFVSENINFLNKTIQISNGGIVPGGGFSEFDFEISQKTLNIPTIIIGVTTAIEMKLNNYNYILSTKDIDDYVNKISKLIGESLNYVLLR